ncbi:MAG: enoyl-CoA hydratase/isomerase family protein [Rhodanobacteraceae bacterium]|nr:enoyl-CoA hydratase/isomerase family protein [Rhodanobacteraceae bacterium]MBP9153691.1 enoyl-CoA hydratase/isomerase family protein [Xanthomonadales bacterium]HQW81557.1 enoyl-CoA hydratase/isomerase family protein [Pseudomonadota bacterium]
MTSSVRIDRRGAIADLVIDRGAVHNAFDDVLIAELTAALKQLDGDERVRAIVLSGAGSTFSAGADLNWMRRMASASADENRDDALKLAELMRTLHYLGKPTVARVNGSAYGGGVGLVACCDHAIAVSDAKFSLSEVKLGLVPAVISPYVVGAIGLRHARRLFVSGEVFDADYALRIDLVHDVVPAAELDAAVDRAVHFLGKGGPIAQREAKQLALRQSGMTLESQLGRDTENADLIARLRVSAEGQEGLTSFLDKRPPRWVG